MKAEKLALVKIGLSTCQRQESHWMLLNGKWAKAVATVFAWLPTVLSLSSSLALTQLQIDLLTSWSLVQCRLLIMQARMSV
jgi:hypothetical protein